MADRRKFTLEYTKIETAIMMPQRLDGANAILIRVLA